MGVYETQEAAQQPVRRYVFSPASFEVGSNQVENGSSHRLGHRAASGYLADSIRKKSSDALACPVSQIVASMVEFGFTNPILLDSARF